MGLIRPYITYRRPLPDGVETPVMVDTLKNMLCYGFKRILHVIYCGVVGCEFTVYLEITNVCFIPSWLHVFAVGPQYQYLICYSVNNITWKTHTKSSENSCRFKTWMDFQEQKLVNLGTSSIWGFLQLPVWCPLCKLYKHAGGHSATTEAYSSPHLTCWGLCAMGDWKLYGAISTMLLSSISLTSYI